MPKSTTLLLSLRSFITRIKCAAHRAAITVNALRRPRSPEGWIDRVAGTRWTEAAEVLSCTGSWDPGFMISLQDLGHIRQKPDGASEASTVPLRWRKGSPVPLDPVGKGLPCGLVDVE